MKKFFNLNNTFSHLPKRDIQNEVWANPVRDWMILLLLSLLILLSVFGYAMYRFYIWQNLEEHLPTTKGNEVHYQESKAQQVMTDFLERRSEFEQISGSATTFTPDSTTPAATTEITDEEVGEGSTNPDGVGIIRAE